MCYVKIICMKQNTKQSWRCHSTRLQTILQDYSNRNIMVLVQKQIHGPMGKVREPRNKADMYNNLIFYKVDNNKR